MHPSPLAVTRRGDTGALRAITRGDLAVIAFTALGVGNLWARRGAGNAVVAANPPEFVLGFGLIVAALLLCVVATRSARGLPRPGVVAAALLTQALLQPAFIVPTYAVYAMAAALAFVPFVRRPVIAWSVVGVVAALTVVWAVQAVGSGPPIDVLAEVQGSTTALLHGQNPYSAVYPLFLGSPGHTVVYGAGSLDYGPMVVLASLPARLLGDVRYTALLLNVSILAALLVWARRSAALRRAGPTIAAVWVASPFIPIMVLLEWTDSFSMAGFAWWLVLRDRHRSWAIVCLTLAMASKPAMLPLMVPLLLWERDSWREVVWSVAGALALAAPFALWTGIARFVSDVVGLCGAPPTRHDSVNLNGLSTVLGHGLVPATLLLAASVAAVAIFVWRRPRDYGDLGALGAGLMIVLVLCAKQAFMNYYYDPAICLLFVAWSGVSVPSRPLVGPIGNARAFLVGIPRRRARRRAGSTAGVSDCAAALLPPSASALPSPPPAWIRSSPPAT